MLNWQQIVEDFSELIVNNSGIVQHQFDYMFSMCESNSAVFRPLCSLEVKLFRSVSRQTSWRTTNRAIKHFAVGARLQNVTGHAFYAAVQIKADRRRSAARRMRCILFVLRACQNSSLHMKRDACTSGVLVPPPRPNKMWVWVWEWVCGCVSAWVNAWVSAKCEERVLGVYVLMVSVFFLHRQENVCVYGNK